MARYCARRRNLVPTHATSARLVGFCSGTVDIEGVRVDAIPFRDWTASRKARPMCSVSAFSPSP